MIDLARAIKAPFADAEWMNKTLIGFLVGFGGLIFFPLYAAFTGIEVDYIRRVRAGDDRLPDWSGFMGKWKEGLVVWAAGFLYFLPVIALAVGFVIPPVIASMNGGSDDAIGALLAGGFCFVTVVAVAYSVVLSILFQAAVVNYAMRGTFGSLFAFGEILALVRGGTGYWTAWLYSIVISFGMSAVSSVLSSTVVGSILFPAVSYLGTAMTGHVLGQWAIVAFPLQPAYASPPAPPTPPAYQPPAPPSVPAPPTPPAPASQDVWPPEPPVQGS